MMTHSPSALRRRMVQQVTNERGSVVASVAFVVTAALMAASLLSLTLAAHLTTSSTTANRNVINSVAQAAEAHRGSPASPAPECTGNPCSTVTSVEEGGLLKATVRGSDSVSGRSLTLEQSLRPVEGTHISGFDSAGNPVWTNITEGSPAKFHGYVNGGTE